MPVDVLIVEDLHNVRGVLVDMLHGVGDFRIVATHSTEAEALDWLDRHPQAWDLAVVDLVLDQGSGMGVIRRCRATAPQGKVVVFSNFVTPVIREHCLKLGADEAFDKDTQVSQFVAWCASASPRPLESGT